MELFSVDRFIGEVNPNLICPICMCVLNDPVQVRGVLETKLALEKSNFFY